MTTLADIRDTALTYAPGDVVGYVSPLGVTPPVDSDVALTVPPWYCLGWLETSGFSFKPTRSLKEITAAGSLSSIRTIVTSEVKTVTITCLEAMNPWVRALFDDVPLLSTAPGRVDTGVGVTSGSTVVTDTKTVAGDAGKIVSGTGIPAAATIVSVIPGTSFVLSAAATATNASVTATIGEGATKVGYVLPEVRATNQYAFLFDSFDGDKKNRLFGVRGQVNNPGDEVLQQADIDNITLEITFYPDNITLDGKTTRGTVARYLQYGAANIAPYFT